MSPCWNVVQQQNTAQQMAKDPELLESVIAITLKDLPLPKRVQGSPVLEHVTLAKETADLLRQNKDYKRRCRKLAEKFGCLFFEEPNGDVIFAKVRESHARAEARRTAGKRCLELRPTVGAPHTWYPERPPEKEWDRLRKIVLDRDNHTCRFCGHRALKWMNIHHVGEPSWSDPDNLITTCVACHAVLHTGRNLALGIIEIWNSKLSQVGIVQRTREAIKQGKSLAEIKSDLPLSPAALPPGSPDHAKDALSKIGDRDTISLPKPLCAVFVNLKRWQLD